MHVLQLHNSSSSPRHKLLVAEFRVHLPQLGLDRHRVDRARHDPPIPRLWQHRLQHHPELLQVLHAHVGLDQALLLLVVLVPGSLPLLLGQVLVHLVLEQAVVVVDVPHHLLVLVNQLS